MNLRNWNIAIAMVGLTGLFVAGCETKNGMTDGSAMTDGGVLGDGAMGADIGAPPPGLVAFKNAGETAEANFEGNDSAYLVVPYVPSDVAADAIDYTIEVTGATGAKTFALKQRTRSDLQQRNPRLWARWQRRLAVEAWTRQLAENAAASLRNIKKMPDMSHLIATCSSAQCPANQVCHAGTCKETVPIQVGSFAQSGGTIDTVVKKKGTVAAILADTTATISETDAKALLDEFESVIYPRDVALFGNPALSTGGATLSSDRNGDGLVWLVLTDKVKDKNAVGFFVATDFEAATENAKSNEADILYIQVPDGNETPVSRTFGILAHEFQHLLNFGSKVYRPKVQGGTGALEALWLDEGQAHFAEDACGYGGENVTLLNETLFPTFGDTSMFETSKDSLAMRAMAMLYVRYLFEQKGGVKYNGATIEDLGGAAWLQALHMSDKQGTNAIDNYPDVFGNWLVAVALDGRGTTTYPKYVYQPLVADAVTNSQIGVKIRGKRKDYTGAEVTLEGPLEANLGASANETMPNATAKYFLLTGQSGKVSVKVTSQEAQFRYLLIRLK